MTSLRRPVLVVMLVAFSISGCFTYQGPVAPPPTANLPYAARVTTSAGTVFRMEALSIRGDSLVGALRDNKERQQAIPLADVTRIEPLRFNALRTTLFVSVPLLLAYLINEWIESTVIIA